jgi:hypothetical protein
MPAASRSKEVDFRPQIQTIFPAALLAIPNSLVLGLDKSLARREKRAVAVSAEWGSVVGKGGRFRTGVANRAFMMGFGVYLRALALVVGGGV